MEGKKPILCLDFDGVIHSYKSGWHGAEVVPDPPVGGALEFIREATQAFRVTIYSSRSGQRLGIEAMQFWLRSQFYKSADPEEIDPIMDLLEWPTQKPPAMVGIDDRVLTFTGTWPEIDELLAFKPWNKEGGGHATATKDAENAALTARVAELEKANNEAVILIDEVNKRKSSRAFYGIGQGLHGKLATVRATLARQALTGAP